MNVSAVLVLGSFLLVAGLTFAIAVLLLRLLPSVRADRLAAAPPTAGGDLSILRFEERTQSGWPLVERLGRAVATRDTTLLARARRALIRAGFHDPRAVSLFLGAKAALALCGVVSYTVYGMAVHLVLPHVLPVSVLLGALGFFLPDAWLRLRVRTRLSEITNALPEILDLMMVCVEAGMGFDAAIARIAEQPGARNSPLHEELLRMHLEVRAGRPREEALRAFAQRINTEEIKSVVSAFVQTDRLGTPLGRTLRIQAEASRVQRRHRAEKKAQIAPVMMLFPTVLFLMPSFMMVAMAPSLIRLFELLTSAGTMIGP